MCMSVVLSPQKFKNKKKQKTVSKFDAFRAQYNFNRSWPPSIDDIVNFIAYLSSEGYSCSSAKTYLSGISFIPSLMMEQIHLMSL